jgi:hypothetical protein
MTNTSKRTSAFAAAAAATMLSWNGRAVADEPAAGAVKVGYRKGFFIENEDGTFTAALQARVQPRLTLEEQEVEDGSYEEIGNFAIQRARLKLGGRAFSKAVKYLFQMDLGKGLVTLKDFYLDAIVSGEVRIRAGQWKRPFSRQQINSSGNLDLVDRAITDKFFGGSRDIGVAIHNHYEKSPEFEWAIGVFNGTGETPSQGVDCDDPMDPTTCAPTTPTNVPSVFEPAVVVRAGYNSGGIKGYSEADFEGGPFRFGVAASLLAELDFDDDGASDGRAEVDAIAKVEGFSASGGVYVASLQDGATFADRAHAATGFHIQVGHLLSGRYQPVARYALIAVDGADNDQQEFTGGFSIYWEEHGLKWQTDVSALVNGSADDPDGHTIEYRGRSQVQLSF